MKKVVIRDRSKYRLGGFDLSGTPENTVTMEASPATDASQYLRRPMNNFMIFSKRYRAVVRDKCPTKDNRYISKILGGWWLSLDESDKRLYTDLAKQNKDKFFEAHPDFKWYKVPALPLRTPSNRFRDVARTAPAPSPAAPPPTTHSPPSDATNNNCTRLDLNTRRATPTNHSQASTGVSAAFTPGKLADEAHMGGISTLLAGPPACGACPPSATHNETAAARALQDVLFETTRLFQQDLESSPPRYPCTSQDVIDQVVDERLPAVTQHRARKGERYRQFVANGGLRALKRSRRDYDHDYEQYQESVTAPASPVFNAPSARALDTNDVDDSDSANEESSTSAVAATSSIIYFDLEARIPALPALDFDNYVLRKNSSKRKKSTRHPSKRKKSTRHPSKRKNSTRHPSIDHTAPPSASAPAPEPSPEPAPEAAPGPALMPPRPPPPAIGSQKRKPRKNNIIRLEVNSLTATVTLAAPEVFAAARAALSGADSCPVNTGEGMLGLNTLAEEATRRMDLSRLPHRRDKQLLSRFLP